MTDRERFEAWARSDDSPFTSEAEKEAGYKTWVTSRKWALIDADKVCRAQSDCGGGWLDSGVDVRLFRLGAEACMDDIERLATPEGEQG